MLKKVGLGLRIPYTKQIIENHAEVAKKIGWLEVHSENYYAAGGPSINTLIEVRKNFPISLHSVGNSLGSASGIDLNHLEKLKKLIKIIDPFLVSDHISWGYLAGDKRHLNDLLPLPYNKKVLQLLCRNISQVQDFLKREILIENPSTYLAFKNPEMTEFEFINEVAKKTGCKLLLDVNNVFVSASNNAEFDAKNYLKNIDKKIVKEIHLAGHSSSEISDGKNHKEILIDTHNDVVRDEVWQLYEIAIQRFGEVPTLIEWDQDFPEFEVLLSEAKKAENIIKKYAKI
jgi:uncharacterized protein (UPF0276 family)